MQPRVLITGGAGFIGSNVARAFLRAGYQVFIYDRFVVYSNPNPNLEQPGFAFRLKDIYDSVTLIRGSTLDKDFLRRRFTEIAPDVTVHMAAMPLAAVAIEHTEEAFQSILNSTQNLLEIMRDVPNPGRLVYASSSMVYGDFKTPEVDEESHPKDPKDIYGAFKLAGEIVVRAYAKNYDLDYTIVRPSAVYGPTDTNNRVIQKFVGHALRGQPIAVDGDGSMKLDFTFVEDCAQGIFLAATRPQARGNTYHVTRGEGRSLKELIEVLGKHFPALNIEQRPAPRYMPSRGTLSIARAARELGFAPSISLEEGVRRYVEHLRTHSY